MSKSKADLDKRMKEYEYVTRTYLTRRTPVIIRLDGKAFHTFTRGFNKPFDEIMVTTMQQTMKYLCENISGCVLGYTQSDEITLVLTDYKKLTTEAWFNNNIQKICSISASMATLAFNMFYKENVDKLAETDNVRQPYMTKRSITQFKNTSMYDLDIPTYKFGFFDSRCFNIPKEEVNNCLLWRQQDATRNSIEALAQSLYPAKEIEGITTKQLQDKMFTEKGINWNDLPTTLKRGSCCMQKQIEMDNSYKPGETVIRNIWVIDNDIPIFSQDSNYVNSRIIFD
jgi:tRNA(His) 5'-end guanylyltransferase